MNKKPSVITDVYLSDPYLVDPSDYHVQFTIRNPYSTTMLVDLKNNFHVFDFCLPQSIKTNLKLLQKGEGVKFKISPKNEKTVTGLIPHTKGLVDEHNSMFDINYHVLDTDILETLEIRSKAKTPGLLTRGHQSELIEKYETELYRLFWIFHTVGKDIINGDISAKPKKQKENPEDLPGSINLLPKSIYLWGDRYMVSYLPIDSVIHPNFGGTKHPTVVLFKNGQYVESLDLHIPGKTSLIKHFIENLYKSHPGLFRSSGFSQILTKHMLMENEENPQITQAIVNEICRIFNKDNIRMKYDNKK